ncbi:hypothetical protein [Nocardia sp. GCM10030253]|uniref:hypothetical protein n=1 Tax=Nocardia sp. GCM10030253 TaxID=3273404 RepID=UPI003671B68E
MSDLGTDGGKTIDDPLGPDTGQAIAEPMSQADVMWGASMEVRNVRARGPMVLPQDTGQIQRSPVRRRQLSRRARLRAELDDVLGTPPRDERAALVNLVAEADLHAFDLRRSSKRWGRAYFILGLPAAILAGIAGAAGLSSEQFRVTAAIIALVSAGLSAAATFLNSEDRASTANTLGAAWQELADDSRMEVLKFARTHPDGPNEIGDVLLHLHRRKSRLLRGALPSHDQGDTPEAD